jgi:hypothetical protein
MYIVKVLLLLLLLHDDGCLCAFIIGYPMRSWHAHTTSSWLFI